MLLKFSRLFIYASLVSVLFVNKSLFFPFITGKQIFFRLCIEGALACFLMYVISAVLSKDAVRAQHTLQTIKRHLMHPVVICLGVFALALMISAVFSPTPGIAFWSNYERGDGAFQILHYVLFAILLKVLFTDHKKWNTLLVTNIIVSIPMSLYAIGQMFASSGSTTFIAAGDRISGTLGNPSYLAVYLIFNLAFIFYFLLNTKDTLVRVSLSVLAVVQILLMIKAQTLGAALGVLVGLIVFAIHLLRTTHHKKVKKTGLIIGICTIGFLLFFLGTRQLTIWKNVPLFGRLTNLQNAYEGIQPRIWTWHSALQGIAERPITGWGLENFAIPFDTYYNPLHYGRESFFDRTHDIFLEYLIAGGLLGFIPWILLFVFYYKSLKKRPQSIWKSTLIAIPVMYLVQGVFLFDVLGIYIPFFLFLIFVVNTNDTNEHALPVTTTTASPLAYTGMAVVLISIGTCTYLTGFRALKRNVLITNAITSENILISEMTTRQGQLSKTPLQVLNEFHDTINYPSPIGKGEAIEMYQKFIIDFLGVIVQVPDITKSAAAQRDVTTIMNDLNEVVDANLGIVPGIKDRYVNASTNIRVGLIFNLPEFTKRGTEMLEADLARAPHRIELIIALLDLAKETKDTELFKKWGPLALSLRPDIFKVATSSTDKAK